MENTKELLFKTFSLIIEMLNDYKDLFSQDNLHRLSLDYSHWDMNTSLFAFKKSFSFTVKYILNYIVSFSNIGNSHNGFEANHLFYTLKDDDNFDKEQRLEEKNTIREAIVSGGYEGDNSTLDRYMRDLNEIRNYFNKDKYKCIAKSKKDIREYSEYVKLCNDLIDYFKEIIKYFTENSKSEDKNEIEIILFKNKIEFAVNQRWLLARRFDMDEQTGYRFICKSIMKINEGIENNIERQKIVISDNYIIYNNENGSWTINLDNMYKGLTNIIIEYKNNKSERLKAYASLVNVDEGYEYKNKFISVLNIQNIWNICQKFTRDKIKDSESEKKNLVDSL